MPDPESSPTQQPFPRGTLTMIRGCMFSGKTTALLANLVARPPDSYKLFKHQIDDRYASDAVVSHLGQVLPARKIGSARDVMDVLGANTRLVAIDEGHFFDDEIVDVIREVQSRGLACMVTALDRDSWARPFPLIDQLADMADEDIILHTDCAQCHEMAVQTQRLTPVTNGNMVGGPESYEPRCHKCWTPPVVLAIT